MSFLRSDDISISATSMLMMAVGFWQTKSRRDECTRNATLVFTIMSFAFLMSIEIRNVYRTWGDLVVCLYPMSSSFYMLMPLFKMFVLFPRREKLFYLIKYTKHKFLRSKYDNYEASVVASCKRKCSFFVCFFVVSIIATIITFVVNPIIANIGRNESDRQFPFIIDIDFPVTMTPYFEILFFLEVIAIYPVVFSYLCFDNFLCIMSIHVGGQFRILQYRMSNMDIINNIHKQGEISDMSLSKLANDYYNTFKSYIRQHQTLIAYCDLLEEVFSLIVFMQMLTLSLSICIDGFQIFLIDESDRQMVFLLHLMSAICQLLMFTYSCDSIIRESRKVSSAAYGGPWYHLPSNGTVKKLKRDLMLVTMRSNTPCCLTANGFFVVSLETFNRVLSTAASYFTLLKESQDAASS